MARFRFRAQSALDLRQREYDEARRVVAAAERALAEAEAELQRTCVVVERIQAEMSEVMRTSDGADRLHWYRLWLIRLGDDRQRHTAAVAARAADVAAARHACLCARQKVESLRRLRDNAALEHQRMQQAIEQKDMDMLATMRFVAARQAP